MTGQKDLSSQTQSQPRALSNSEQMAIPLRQLAASGLTLILC